MIFYFGSISAQFEIKIHTNNIDDSLLIVSTPNGERPAILDTIRGDSTGLFIYKGDTDLESGVYFVGKKRNKQMYKLIIKPDDDTFDVYFDFLRRKKIKVQNSPENKIYVDYLISIDNLKLKSNLLSRGQNQVKLDSVHRLMNNVRLGFINKHKGTLAALLIKSELDWVDPVFNGVSASEFEKKLLDYKVKHYLDNLDFSNSVTFRLPGMHKELMRYFDKILILKPSIVNNKIDDLFGKMGYESKMYEYYLPFFLKKYNKGYKGWFDTVYVHIARKYYNKEKAPWIPQNTHAYVQDQADRKELTLNGKIIPDITFVTQKGDSVRLLDIPSEYMVLVFWRPGCSHCRHAMPILNNLRKEFKNKGVKIVTVCTRQRSDTYRCWDGVKKENMGKFAYNLADKGGKTKFLRKFNVGGVPMIYILDKNKRIIDKNIKARNLIVRLKEIVNKD